LKKKKENLRKKKERKENTHILFSYV